VGLGRGWRKVLELLGNAGEVVLGGDDGALDGDDLRVRLEGGDRVQRVAVARAQLVAVGALRGGPRGGQLGQERVAVGQVLRDREEAAAVAELLHVDEEPRHVLELLDGRTFDDDGGGGGQLGLAPREVRAGQAVVTGADRRRNTGRGERVTEGDAALDLLRPGPLPA